MIVNGNLKFHTLGSGEIQNAIVERLAGVAGGSGLPANGGNGATASKGRIVYNTDDNIYYYWNGAVWQPFSTGGDASALQSEVDNIESSIGGAVNTNGTFNAAAFGGAAYIVTPTSITNALLQLDSAINSNNTLAELDDVNFATGPTDNDVLQYDSTTSKWINVSIGGSGGIQPYDAGLANLATGGTGVVSMDGDSVYFRTLTAATGAGLQGVAISNATGVAGNPTIGLDIHNLTAIGSVGSANELVVWDGTNNVRATVAQLTDGIIADGIAFNDLTDVTLSTVTSGDILYHNGSAWVNSAPGSTSGVQAWNTGLQDIADVGATTAADQFYYSTSAGTLALGTMTSFGRSLVDDVDAAAARTTLGVVIGTNVQAWDADLDTFAGLNAGWADSTFLVGTGGAEGSRFQLESGATVRTSMGLGDIATMDQDDFIRTNGTSTITADIPLSNFKLVSVANPVNAQDAATKNYVDGLIAGLVWLPPIDTPALIGDNVADLTSISSPVEGDAYILPSDTVHSGAAGWLVEYQPTSPRNGTVAVPGATGWYQVMDVAAELNGGHAGDKVRFGIAMESPVAVTPVGTVAAKEGQILQLTKTGTVNIGTAAQGALSHASPGFTLAYTTPTGGQAVLSHIAKSYHYGNQLTFSGTYAQATHGTDGTNYWTHFGGTQAVQAGVGLYYSGNILNVGLGAGIHELPGDEVGVDLYDASTGAIILTTDGSTRSTATGAKVHLKLNNAQLNQDANGLFIVNSGITATQLATSVAGAGLSGGGGAALSVNVDNSSIEIDTDTLRVKADGITNAMLLNDTIGFAGDTGTGSVALGSSFSILTGQGLTSVGAAGSVTISGDDADYTSKGVASFDSNHFTVTTGAVSLKNTSIALSAETGTGSFSLLTGGAFSIGAGTGIDTSVTGTAFTVALNANISDLNDVNDSGRTNGDLLTWTGTDWTPVARATMVGSVTLDNLSDVVASHVDGNILVSNGTNWVNQKAYHLYTSSGQNTTHTVTHNIGQKYCNVTVVDSTDEVIIPQSITFSDANNLVVTFNTAIECKVIVMGIA